MSSRRAFILLVAVLLPLLPHTAGSAESTLNRRTTITIYPVTTGVSHPPAQPIARVLVVGHYSSSSITTAIAAAKELFHRGGILIIEKTPPLTLSQDLGPHSHEGLVVNNKLLTFGKEAGADHLILLDVTDTLVLDKEGGPVAGYLHDERVSIRGIGVATGAIVLEGTARWSPPVERPGQHIRQLTAYAIARPLCLTDKWEEASAANDGRGKCRRREDGEPDLC